ncbi:MAG: Dna2/Cas4 domain-containing protein [Clostridiales bacterium]|nr:Dna2/Cas4 domain-containing protein [Clostridiales bacterium]
MANDDSDFLMLSGLKHFQFCRRRWALVHVEQQWEENALTLEGHYMHERVHDNSFTEARGAVLLSRGMPVRSQALKLTGVCDMVELYAKLKHLLLKEIDEEKDSLRFYSLGNHYKGKVEHFGVYRGLQVDEPLIL